jgi:hypothetical protein
MSDMYLVQPINLTAANLLSTTAPEPTPAWVSGTSYAKDAMVIYTSTKTGLLHAWLSLVAANTATPGTDKLKWLDAGASNRHAMLDAYNSSQTQANGSLTVEIQPGAVYTTLALFNLAGTTVRLEMIDATNATIFDETKDLAARPTASWSEYYILGFAGRLTQAIFNGMPFAPSAKVRITLAGAGVVGIGRMVVGRRQVLGCLEYGAQPFITDYSRKQWDADFGDYEWTVRDYSRGFRGTLWIDNAQLNRVWSTLISVRAVPTLWVGSEDAEFSETLVSLGVMQDAPASINYPTKSLLNFTVEGLT